MKSHGARTGRRLLASTSWLLLLTGLSCKYNVTLPWTAPEDAKAREPAASPDTSFDQAPAPSPDLPIPSPDARPACPNLNNKPLNLERGLAQIVIAIDQSSSMQGRFDTTTKLQAAVAAVRNSAANHQQMIFQIIWFPGTNCGSAACCATQPRGLPEAFWGCGGSDAGCLSSSNESPSHHALETAKIHIGKSYWAWNTLVLITDQDPKCSGEPSSEAACAAAREEVAAIGTDSAVKTFVVVPSADGRSPLCLTNIANQNPRSFSDARDPIVAKNSKEMLDQLERITAAIDNSLCSYYPKESWIELGQVEQVKIAGEIIPRDESGKSGWKQVGRAIQLSEPECTRIRQNSGLDVKAFACASGSGYGPGGGPNGN
jgi:hypothetical protein